jgi:hypothetical protein
VLRRAGKEGNLQAFCESGGELESGPMVRRSCSVVLRRQQKS